MSVVHRFYGSRAASDSSPGGEGKRTGFGGQDACERCQSILDKRAETLSVRA